MSTLKWSLKGIAYSEEENKLSALLSTMLIFRDFLRDCRKNETYQKYSESNVKWIKYNLEASLKKAVSYVVPSPERKALERLRRKNDALKDQPCQQPLVTVIIPTYNRPELLLTRSLPSVLKQTYKNLEVLVIGDHCTDNTERFLREQEKQDARVKFTNLPERGKYPKEPILRWCVAGVAPMNEGLRQSRGRYIAHLDDDDEFTEDYIEKAILFVVQHDLEMVYGILSTEQQNGSWTNVGEPGLKLGGICRSASLYRGYLKLFLYDIEAWKFKEPADFNLWRRMKKAGVRIGFLNSVVGKHYKERTQLGR